MMGVVLGVGLILSGCSQATSQASSTSIPTGILTPYQTVSPSPTNPRATIQVIIPITPAPTATPIFYIVKGEDTMLSIAYQFGISWQELQAANPKVDPRAMGEGLKLIIPSVGDTPETLPTATPVPVNVKAPICYPAGDGGAWCVASITNALETSLENLSVWIGLYNPNGEIIASQEAYAPLNILRPGSSMPLMAYFTPPLPDVYQAQSEVLSGLAVAADDARYVDLQARVDKVEISQDGNQATVSGEVITSGETPGLTQLWALAVAYDAKGDIVGKRKWKSGGEMQFEISVYSLGGKIDRVEMLVEARP